MDTQPDMKDEIKDEAMLGVMGEFKSEFKAEPKVKLESESVKLEQDIKREPGTGPTHRMRFKRPKLEVKEEPREGVAAHPETCASTKPSGTKISFAMRLPMWIKQCIDFHKESRTWAPTRPCCLANLWLEPRHAPTRNVVHCPKSCYHKLSKQQRKEFRQFIESGQAEEHSSLKELLHPELQCDPQVKKPQKRGDQQPKEKRLPAILEFYPWLKNLPVQLWAGRGWKYGPDPTGVCTLPSHLVLARMTSMRGVGK